MHYAIIAAGDGSRLTNEGIPLPKPLVKINGETLIERLIRIFNKNGAESISIIINSTKPQLAEYMAGLLQKEKNINLISGSTPSSVHSFYELRKFIKGPFCLTTVDTVFDEDEFAEYIAMFRNNTGAYDGVMGVTDYIDDEKPLYVRTTPAGEIEGFYDEYSEGIRYISAGIYSLKPVALEVLDRFMLSGQSRMRNYQRALVEAGLRLYAYPFGKVIDIDHKSDIEKAEKIARHA